MLTVEDIYSQIGPAPQKKNKVKKEVTNFYDLSPLTEIDNINSRTFDNTSCRRHLVNKIICDVCQVEMSRRQTEYICDNCGRIEESVGDDMDMAERGGEGVNNYNTSGASAAPVTIAGPGCFRLKKKLMCDVSSYRKQQKKNTAKQMDQIIRQYTGPKPSQKIIEQAIELYYGVQQHRIIRGDVRVGTMAACVYRICIEENVSRKPKEIAKLFNIAQEEFSGGEKILDELYAEGLLQSNHPEIDNVNFNNCSDQFYFNEENEIKSFLERYFECLNIPQKHMHFAIRLIKFTIKYKIAETSITSSKCAGTIHILTSKLDLEITRNDIEKACQISKSTFGRFYHAVFNMLESTDKKYIHVRSRLRRIFKVAKVSYLN